MDGTLLDPIFSSLGFGEPRSCFHSSHGLLRQSLFLRDIVQCSVRRIVKMILFSILPIIYATSSLENRPRVDWRDEKSRIMVGRQICASFQPVMNGIVTAMATERTSFRFHYYTYFFHSSSSPCCDCPCSASVDKMHKNERV